MAEQRIYRMRLPEFHRYLRDKVDELEGCQKQTDEVKRRIEEIFKREMAAWQQVFGFCYPRILADRAQLPPRFAAHFDAIEVEETQRIRAEITDLQVKIDSGRQRMDELMSQGQLATADLRRVNPNQNALEEKLKEKVVQYQDEYAQAFETIDRLESSPWGWLSHWTQIKSLKRVQHQAREAQQKTMLRLRQVRQDWLTMVEKAGDTQANLRTEWQKISIEVSEAQSRHDHLEANLAALAEQAAARRLMEEMDDPLDTTGELHDKLDELVARNRVRLAYEKGMAASAEALGLEGGIGKGLARFRDSVGQVVQEQKRYNLAQVDVLVPSSVAVINQTWKQLHAKVEDDKYMADHPLEFADLVQRYLSDRLTDTTIKAFFEEMGDALNHATKKWG